MNDNVLPKCDTHHWPGDGMVLTTVESNVDASFAMTTVKIAIFGAFAGRIRQSVV